MATGRTNLDEKTARRWSDLGHFAFIEAITSEAVLKPKQFAFHGGTSLHLSWNSPRFSEDLDFLLNRTLAGRMKKLMPRIAKRMKAILEAHEPGLDVEILDKTKEGSNLINWRLALSSKQVRGSTHVKAEFWQVEPGYLDAYQTNST